MYDLQIYLFSVRNNKEKPVITNKPPFLMITSESAAAWLCNCISDLQAAAAAAAVGTVDWIILPP